MINGKLFQPCFCFQSTILHNNHHESIGHCLANRTQTWELWVRLDNECQDRPHKNPCKKVLPHSRWYPFINEATFPCGKYCSPCNPPTGLIRRNMFTPYLADSSCPCDHWYPVSVGRRGQINQRVIPFPTSSASSNLTPKVLLTPKPWLAMTN